MKTSLRIRLGVLLVLAAALAGCEGPCSTIKSINGPQLEANGVDLSRYVAVGTSLSASYMSGGIVDRHQVNSFPALVAQQIGKTVSIDGGSGSFTQPTVNMDGIPALTEVKSYRPLIVNNTGRTTGAPTNFSQNLPYHNLGIPGAVALDLVDTTHYDQTAAPVFRTNFTYFNLIQRNRGSLLAQALSLAPTLLSIEYGANEVLGPTTSGVAPNNATNSGYAAIMTAALNTIHTASPNTRVAVFNVPDVTSIPFFTTFPPATVNATTGLPMALVGANGPLEPNDLVLLTAGSLLATGTGIPTGGANFVNPAAPSNGQPLPESVILRASEVTLAQAEIDQINAVVDSVAARPFVAKVDIHDYFADIAVNGLRIGANDYTTDFITGGLFSLDGVHPNPLGYALMANRMIEAVNARFGCTIPRVNPAQYATAKASTARPADLPRYPGAIEGLDESLDLALPFRSRR
ncbi:MAG: hypothetical protein RL721_1774 [Candidatus Eisenbacteria bacterium]|jgi:lysophospholipase L1-like esterase